MDSYLRFGDLFGQSGWEEKMGAKGERKMGNRGREIYLPALEGGGPQIFLRRRSLARAGDERAREQDERGSRWSAGEGARGSRRSAGEGTRGAEAGAGAEAEGERRRSTRSMDSMRSSSSRVFRHRGERRLGVLFRRRFLPSLPPSSINLLSRHQNTYVTVI